MGEPEKKPQRLMAAIVTAVMGLAFVLLFVPSLRVVGATILLGYFLLISEVLNFNIYRDFFYKSFERKQRKDHDPRG
jgi:hypothetical protein